MLRPAGPSVASLIVDGVFFVEVDAPTPTPSPTPTPTESAAATATASETPSPIVAAGAPGSPGPGVPPSEHDEGVAREAAPKILLRITELLSNPIAPGPDTDLEWIEVTNVGSDPLPLAGLVLEDNAASVALPELVLPPGGSLVVGGVSAEIGEALAVRLPGGLFNGLGNKGDRVALLTADGRRIDALSYGSDATYDQPPLAAPGPGESIERRFAKNGTLTAIAISSRPSPGRTDVPTAFTEVEAATPAAETPTGTASAGGPAEALREPLEGSGNANRAAWIVLILLALGGLVGAGAFRVRELRR